MFILAMSSNFSFYQEFDHILFIFKRVYLNIFLIQPNILVANKILVANNLMRYIIYEITYLVTYH